MRSKECNGIGLGDTVRVKKDNLDWGEGVVTDYDDAPYVTEGGAPRVIVHFQKRDLVTTTDKLVLVSKE